MATDIARSMPVAAVLEAFAPSHSSIRAVAACITAPHGFGAADGGIFATDGGVSGEAITAGAPVGAAALAGIGTGWAIAAPP